MVVDKIYLGPCAKRSEGWERVVAAGRLAIHQHSRHQQDLLAAVEAAEQARAETAAREEDHLQRGDALRQELEEMRRLLEQHRKTWLCEGRSHKRQPQGNYRKRTMT